MTAAVVMLAVGLLGVLPACAIAGARAEAVALAPLIGAGIIAVGAWIEVLIGGDLRLLAVGVGAVVWTVSAFRVRAVLHDTVVDARSLLLMIGPLAALAWTLQSLHRYELLWDARSIWLFHARMLYGGHDTFISVAHATPFSHPDYPLLVSAPVAATWQATARIDYRTGQLLIAALTACAVILVGLCVARASKCPTIAAVAVSGALCAALYGLFGGYATNGYADPLCASLTAAAFGYGLLVEPQRWSQSLSLVLIVLTSAAKNEGLAYAGIGLVALLVLRFRIAPGDRLRLGSYGLAAVSLVAWPAIVRVHGISSDLTRRSAGPVEHPGYRFSQLVGPEIAFYGTFPAAVLAVLVVIMAKRSRRDGAILYFAALIGSGVALNLVYVLGPNEIQYWIATSLDRTTQTIQALCLLIITVAGVLATTQLAKARPARREDHPTSTSAQLSAQCRR